MNHIKVEVCVDNIESVKNAVNAGADRIELCSSLQLGGITPTAGLIRFAVRNAPIPVYAMIRPRSGDFLFSNDEVALVNDEIQFLHDMGVDGIVIGALMQDATINLQAVRQWVGSAKGMEVTFHRAFDWVEDPSSSLEQLIDLGCHRVLTSGLQATAVAGIACLHNLVQQAGNRIIVMPGCGVNPANARQIIESTGATEIHLSGKKSRPSQMKRVCAAVMGKDSAHDHAIDVADEPTIRAVIERLAIDRL
ncbi:copper homeostasis protein CutC [Vibrio mangrovi]|uniref:PF03932 family protein CutC n=1 Tax=Vibrio mangrovi TaxID=474394 RepID=A0A1Y6IZF5_9VIBR|nr:copper homeostasis protein CutC [Vibrio mangrovi]MDW6005342.1 copper homeostasis protein CutC [Vibrio mangrovi]SMS03054.1 Copper homeostasis protein CutC [Vibrio mangrovi]